MITIAVLAAAFTASAATRPHAIVAGSLGIPDLSGAHVEVFVADEWSIEAGAGIGLLPLSVHAGVRWSPKAVCPGCWQGHGFRLSPGVLAFVFPSQLEEGMAVLDADAAYLFYNRGFGFSAGARLGVGIAWGNVASGLKLEPAMEVVPVQVGVVF
ncbi:hypothetical protein LBMAG42_43090 [Deltaproteobacteria bacterium]|nr:hypothetical protein LBMAG42_43090 [Deltaproteobacteria bacterium]